LVGGHDRNASAPRTKRAADQIAVHDPSEIAATGLCCDVFAAGQNARKLFAVFGECPTYRF